MTSLSALILALLAASTLAAEPCGRVVVESVAPDSAPAHAGLETGDELGSWRRATEEPRATRAFIGPLDVRQMEIEDLPRGALVLTGCRAGSPQEWTVELGTAGLTTALWLEPAQADAYRAGPSTESDLAAQAALDAWRQAVLGADANDSVLSATVTLEFARRRLAQKDLDATKLAFGEAVRLLDASGHQAWAAEALREWAAQTRRAGDHDAAVDSLRRALTLDERASHGQPSLATAADWHALGRAQEEGDPSASAQDHHKALELREALAPGSPDLAYSFNELGRWSLNRSRFTEAADWYGRAEAIWQRHAMGSLDWAKAANGLGTASHGRGDLAAAEKFYAASLAVRERAGTEADRAVVIQNLGLLARDRGDLALAEERFRSLLELASRGGLRPDLEQLALLNLGLVLTDRGEFALAEQLVRQALEKSTSVGTDPSVAMINLGTVLEGAGDLDGAGQSYEQALALQAHDQSGPTARGFLLQNLASLAHKQGRFERSEEWLAEGRVLYAQENVQGIDLANNVALAGENALALGNLTLAAERFEQARQTWSLRAPDSMGHASALYGLGRAAAATGDTLSSARRSCEAMDVLERQRGRLGGADQARQSFAEQFGPIYVACLEAHVAANDVAAAFSVLERMRARVFLAQLAERDIRPADAPAALMEEEQSLGQEHDKILEDALQLKPEDRPGFDALQLRREQWDAQREALTARTRREAPALADLRYPEPLDAAAAARSLEPGTALLSFVVGARRTILLVLHASQPAAPPNVRAFTLDVKAAELKTRIARLRFLIEQGEPMAAELRASAGDLYDLLLAPAESSFASAGRLLVSPDGPLHDLPFGVLLRRGSKAQLLLEWKPVHVTASATVNARLGRDARPRTSALRIAFGDPDYGARAQKAVPAYTRAYGRELLPLPETRREVRDLAALFPHTEVHLGADATEERVRGVHGNVAVLHLACHGWVDARRPLDSTLALSIPAHRGPGQSNGFLQAWEVIEGLRMNADLVTLSACESGLGGEIRGEGLLGFTRAFQYAGARSVLASLWRLPDASTADLMRRFYRRLKAGERKDDALRAAQLDLMHGRWSAPRYWAGFQLYGLAE